MEKAAGDPVVWTMEDFKLYVISLGEISNDQIRGAGILRPLRVYFFKT